MWDFHGIFLIPEGFGKYTNGWKSVETSIYPLSRRRFNTILQLEIGFFNPEKTAPPTGPDWHTLTFPRTQLSVDPSFSFTSTSSIILESPHFGRSVSFYFSHHPFVLIWNPHMFLLFAVTL